MSIRQRCRNAAIGIAGLAAMAFVAGCAAPGLPRTPVSQRSPTTAALIKDDSAQPISRTESAGKAIASTGEPSRIKRTSLETGADDPSPPVREMPAAQPDDRPLPINLPTALQLANVRAVDIAAAAERIRVAVAVLYQANALWLPTITLGGDYYRHDGDNQTVQGDIFNNSKSGGMLGVGSGIGNAASLNITDAIFTPLAARQQMQAREADRQAASNDTLVAVSEAYFTVQQSRGEVAGAVETTRRIEELIRRTQKLAPGVVPDLEIFRAEAELARRQQSELLARERWKVAGAELVRVLRMDSSAQVEPVEPPQLRVELVDLTKPVDELIPIGLMHRPELASKQIQVQTTLTLLKQERLRPLIPSVLLRGFSTPVAGTLGAGYFGGGTGSSFGSGGLRSDFDIQLLWQLDNLGFGNLGKARQRDAENRVAVIELLRLQDRVAAEVTQAHAQAQLAARRVDAAERGLKSAVLSADKNLIALGETKGVGAMMVLLVRPQEVVAAIQALSQAYIDYYGAVADSNRAQFRLYRALGQPAECVDQSQPMATSSSPVPHSPPPTDSPDEPLPASSPPEGGSVDGR